MEWIKNIKINNVTVDDIKYYSTTVNRVIYDDGVSPGTAYGKQYTINLVDGAYGSWAINPPKGWHADVIYSTATGISLFSLDTETTQNFNYMLPSDTAQYHYEFTGVSPIIQSTGYPLVSTDPTFTAQVTRTVRKYTVSWTVGTGVGNVFFTTAMTSNFQPSGTHYSSGTEVEYGTTVYLWACVQNSNYLFVNGNKGTDPYSLSDPNFYWRLSGGNATIYYDLIQANKNYGTVTARSSTGCMLFKTTTSFPNGSWAPASLLQNNGTWYSRFGIFAVSKTVSLSYTVSSSSATVTLTPKSGSADTMNFTQSGLSVRISSIGASGGKTSCSGSFTTATAYTEIFPVPR